MKNDDRQFVEDAALAAETRAAFDCGEVPARLRATIVGVAREEWLAMRRRRRLRMHMWLSSLSSCAAALAIFAYSTPQLFGPSAGPDIDALRRVDRVMDLVSISYPDEDATDDELAAMALPDGDVRLTAAYVAERFDAMSGDGDDEFFY